MLVSEVSQHLGVASGPAYDTATTLNDFTEYVIDSTLVSEQAKFEKERAKYERYGDMAGWLLAVGAIGFCVWAFRYRKKYIEMYTVNGVYTGIGSSYYAGPDNDSSDSGGGSSGFGGFGGGGGGGFSGGGASGSW